jgi:hypothetical protein
MNVKKELFEIFQNKRSDFELYERLKEFIENVENNARGIENAKFYETLVTLTNSINNAGHEERRSADINYINSKITNIINEYEEFLP